MTKFFILLIMGCGLMFPIQTMAKTESTKKVAQQNSGAKKEIKKNVTAHKVISKKKSHKKKPIAKVIKKSKTVPQRKVVSLDFSEPEKRSVSFDKVQVVKASSLPQRAPASVAKNKSQGTMTVSQLKKSTKPYWSAYCKDGIVLNSHVYCAMKNPQKHGLKNKNTKMASSKNLEAKKRK